ncbi:helix-turn-helix domain-containing protein [Microbacterium saperdae]
MSNISPLVSPGSARTDIAAAVRAHLAVARVSDSEIGRRTGMSQSRISRRTNEEVPFDADDLGRIASALGISYLELIQMPTGVPPVVPNDGTTD